MSLNFHTNFENDIQARDTALVPLILIGDWSYSSNYWTNGWDADSVLYVSTNISAWGGTPKMTLPILLNVPSLKESIDLESRKYKISNVNLSISNLPYEGKRFSERIDDRSLINTECRIFWTSPSTTGLGIVDAPDYELEDRPADALQIYFGIIRKYEHDDEKVKLVIEDRSQASLHKDLPLLENYLGTGEDVPDKYKNKPIPMVYGHVDRSPGVVGTDTIENVADEGADISSGTFKVMFDKSGVGLSFIGGLDTHHRLRHSPLLVYLGETYLPIAWFKDNAKNFQPGADAAVGEYENSNLFVNSSDSTITFNTGNVDSDSRFNNIRVNYPRPLGNTSFVIFSLSYYGQSTYPSYDWDEEPYIHPDYPEENITIYGSPSAKIDGKVLAHYGYVDIDGIRHVKLYSSPPVYIKIILDPISEISDIVEYKGYAFISASKSSTTESTQDDRIMPAIWTKEILNPNHAGNDAGYFYRNIETGQSVEVETYPGSVVFFDGDFDNSSHSGDSQDVPYDSILLQNFSTNDNMINIGIPPHTVEAESGGLPPQVLELGQYFEDLNIVNSFVIEGISNKTYYASVYGRMSSTPTAPEMIKNISEELDIMDIDASGEAVYNTWQYAFTVDKKTNSKKLLEGLASASPYIPRFDNMGNFKFDVIKEAYEKTSGAAGFTDFIAIKKKEVISSSFTRTSINKVYTKVELKYKWDYAKEEFGLRLSFQINNKGLLAIPDEFIDTFFYHNIYGGAYDYKYYGLPDDNSKSTLVIDDDRGKYIRDPETAKKFARWMLRWHCNQHLIIKLRLPLKYMNIEIGDMLRFNEIIDVKPYGIDYSRYAEYEGLYGDQLMENGQQIFPDFMVTSTNKTLEYCDIECIQMHNLQMGDIVDDDPTDEEGIIYGCTNATAWNHDPNATHDNDSCLLPPYTGQGFQPAGTAADFAKWMAMFFEENICPVFVVTTENVDYYADNFPPDQIVNFDPYFTLIDPDNYTYELGDLATAPSGDFAGTYFAEHMAAAKAYYLAGYDAETGTSTNIPKFYNMSECTWSQVQSNKPLRFDALTNHYGGGTAPDSAFFAFHFYTALSGEAFIESPDYPPLVWENLEGQTQYEYGRQFHYHQWDHTMYLAIKVGGSESLSILLRDFIFDTPAPGEFQPISMKIEILPEGYLYKEAEGNPNDWEILPLSMPTVSIFTHTGRDVQYGVPTGGNTNEWYYDFADYAMEDIGTRTIEIPMENLGFNSGLVESMDDFKQCMWTFNFRIKCYFHTFGNLPIQEWSVNYRLLFGYHERPLGSQVYHDEWDG